MKAVFLLFLCYSFGSFAYLPTPEGLFRNVANKTRVLPGVVVSFDIEESEEEDSFETDSDIEDRKMRTVKLYLTEESENNFKLVQVDYERLKSDPSSVLNYAERNNIFYQLRNKEPNSFKNFFQSLMMSLLLNDSKSISSFLRKRFPDYESNKILMNREKVSLYNEYINYLKKIKDNKLLKESLESPMTPEDTEKKASVGEIQKQAFFKKSNSVKLVKEGNSFFWDLSLNGLAARFSNEEKRILSLNASFEGEEVQMFFNNFILFNGSHELPKDWFIKRSGKKMVKLTFTSLRHFTPNKKLLRKKFSKIRKEIKDGNRSLGEDALEFSRDYLY